MKRILVTVLALIMCASLAIVTGCDNNPFADSGENNVSKVKSITVVTTYGGDDGNRDNYEAAIKAYTEKTGVEVLDASQSSTEEFKAQVKTDFEVGSEPDVLFFFTDKDANDFVKAGKVVPIEEIREVYPDYASNMDDSLMPVSPVDGRAYAVPVNGYWEGLFTNKKILAEAGVELPGPDYTWDQFIADCKKIKAAGYIPIDLSVNGMPHYWWEFAVMNNGTPENHHELPTADGDSVTDKWLGGIADIQQIYDLGFLPEDTLTTVLDDAYGSGGYFRQDGAAAFAIDGSWYLGGIITNIEQGVLEGYTIDDFCVSYVPGKGGRKATDIIGGISSGYYITRQAWEDESKRDAVVEFVTSMTTDEVVSAFAKTAVTALKNGTISSDLNSLEKSAVEMYEGATSCVSALQDIMGDGKVTVFTYLSSVIGGRMEASEMLSSVIAKIA